MMNIHPQHSDLHASNIFLRIQNGTILKNCGEAEGKDHSSRKITGQTVVVETRSIPRAVRWIGAKSQPVLCDFGEARTKDSYTGLIQPSPYRAPEVFFGSPFGYTSGYLQPGLHGMGLHASCLVDLLPTRCAG